MSVIMLGTAAFLALSVALVWWHMSPAVLLGGTLAIAGALIIWLHPYVGLHVFIAILFLENAVPSREDVTIMKATGVVVLLGWLMSMATRRHPMIRMDGFACTVLALLTWCALSPLFAIDASQAAGRLFTFAQLGLAALMFRSVANTPGRLKGVYWALVLWIWICTFIAMAEYFLGTAPGVIGIVKSKNMMATYIDIAVICAYLLHGMTRHRGARLFLASSLPLFFLGVALTFSRAGLVALGVALVLVWYFTARQREFVLLFASTAVLLTITLFLPQAFWKRAHSIVPAIQRQEDTFGSRVRLWKVGWAMIQDKPVTGVGAGNFNVAFLRYAPSEMPYSQLATHNAYVGMAAETGLVGLGLYLLLHLVPLRAAGRAGRAALKNQRVDIHLLAVTAQVSIFSIMVGALSGDAQTVKMLWILLGLAAATGGLARPEALPATADSRVRGGVQLPEGQGAWTALPRA